MPDEDDIRTSLKETVRQQRVEPASLAALHQNIARRSVVNQSRRTAMMASAVGLAAVTAAIVLAVQVGAGDGRGPSNAAAPGMTSGSSAEASDSLAAIKSAELSREADVRSSAAKDPFPQSDVPTATSSSLAPLETGTIDGHQGPVPNGVFGVSNAWRGISPSDKAVMYVVYAGVDRRADAEVPGLLVYKMAADPNAEDQYFTKVGYFDLTGKQGVLRVDSGSEGSLKISILKAFQSDVVSGTASFDLHSLSF